MAEKKRRAADIEPSPSKKIKRTIIPEAAAEKDNFKLIRSLDVTALKPSTITALNKHNYDPFVDDPQVKVIMRSGSISNKCELVESEITKRPYKIIAKADIEKDECIGVYMGQLIEATRCESNNIWQYNVPAYRFPRKHGIPNLVIDGSKSANETRFIHNAKWYNKTPNIQHEMVWDVAVHLPQFIFRAKRNIKAGEDILLSWKDVDESTQMNKEANDANSNNVPADDTSAKKSVQRKAAVTKPQKDVQGAEKNQQEQKLTKQQASGKKINEAASAERQRQKAEETKKLQEAIMQNRQRQQEAEKRNAEKIQRRKSQIQTVDQAQQKLQEEINRVKKVQYGVVHITPKHRNNNKDIRTQTTDPEVNLEEPLEIEPVNQVPAQVQAEISKPMTEINFFSEPEIVNNTSPNTSIDSSVVTRSSLPLEDCMFDLNAEIELSDEDEEPIATFVI